MLGFLGSVLGAGSSLLGGLFGKSSADKANDANMQMAQENLAFQKHEATQGLQERAADATAAQTATGINRLALLGASPYSPSPVSAGQVSDTSMGTGIASAGQDIQRAISAYAHDNDRKAELQNKLLEAQIANVNSDTVKNASAASKMATQKPVAPTPLYQNFIDQGTGEIVTLPSSAASTAMQNSAGFLPGLAIGAHMLWDYWGNKHGVVPIRGDVHRAHRPTRIHIDVPKTVRR